MKFIADFHIHSHFSVATSSKLVPEYLELWARIKGINVVGTGDCIHPGWLRELREKLEPAGNGLYRLKEQFQLDESRTLASSGLPGEVYFVLTGEVSSIYKKDGRVRKVHNICVFPDFESVLAIQARLDRIGNITSDGRPILGLDSKILLEMVLATSPESFLIPAHIWTPWFSVLGSKSGFDRIEECYEDLTPHIFAVETGLSSDPAMNWACSFLDRFKLVSNSDAHSPEKLGREANLFDCDMTYRGIYDALKGDSGFEGTIEFFPQEGKYHNDGHRKCGIRWNPLETVSHNGICTVCGKEVTRGVMYRVAQLADRVDISTAPGKRIYYSITQLPDLIAEMLNVKSSSSQAVQKEYFNLIKSTGPEFYCLLFADIEELRQNGSDLLAEGIARLRRGEVVIDEGYDGEFGRISVFRKGEGYRYHGRSLFPVNAESRESPGSDKLSVNFDISAFQLMTRTMDASEKYPAIPDNSRTAGYEFTAEQLEGITHREGPCLVIAGPGSGKTRILTERIICLLKNGTARPDEIIALTFTNNAAREMHERMRKGQQPPYPEIMTFHTLGLSILKKHYSRFGRKENFYIIDEREKDGILSCLRDDKRGKDAILSAISRHKQGIEYIGEYAALLDGYNRELQERNCFDLDDLIDLPATLLDEDAGTRADYQKQYRWLLVDEYQDINARQYDLVKLLAGGGNPNIFVIGDPDQAIYGFRGADIRFITSFQEDFPGARQIELKKSFRCPGTILTAASQALGNRREMIGEGEPVKVVVQPVQSERSEAEWIASSIERMMGGVRSFSVDSGISDGISGDLTSGFSDFAVLCRSSVLFSPIIEAFHNHAIPCQVIGAVPFYLQEPFHEIIQILRRAYYRQDDIETDQQSVREISSLIDDEKDIMTVVEAALEQKEVSPEEKKKFMRLCSRFDSFVDLFRGLQIRTGVDDLDLQADAVYIMTIHGAKGMEFNNVFIPACEEGIIPFTLYSDQGQEDLRDEKRIFYVGATRTRKNLFLSHARRRNFKGRILSQQRSRLIDKIELDLMDFVVTSISRKDDEVQLELF